MDSRAIVSGGLPTAALAIIVGVTTSLPNILLVGLLAGLLTGYLTESWSNELKDGAVAGALAGSLVFLAIGGLAYGSREFGSVYTFLFIAVPIFTIEGLLGAVVAVRLCGSAVARPS